MHAFFRTFIKPSSISEVKDIRLFCQMKIVRAVKSRARREPDLILEHVCAIQNGLRRPKSLE